MRLLTGPRDEVALLPPTAQGQGVMAAAMTGSPPPVPVTGQG